MPTSVVPTTSEPEHFVYQIIDDSFQTRGIFNDADQAKIAALQLPTTPPSGSIYYQINRIPVNTVGNYNKSMDAIWLWDGQYITEPPK